jgi:hypothetical protein
VLITTAVVNGGRPRPDDMSSTQTCRPTVHIDNALEITKPWGT